MSFFIGICFCNKARNVDDEMEDSYTKGGRFLYNYVTMSEDWTIDIGTEYWTIDVCTKLNLNILSWSNQLLYERKKSEVIL